MSLCNLKVLKFFYLHFDGFLVSFSFTFVLPLGKYRLSRSFVAGYRLAADFCLSGLVAWRNCMAGGGGMVMTADVLVCGEITEGGGLEEERWQGCRTGCRRILLSNFKH